MLKLVGASEKTIRKIFEDSAIESIKFDDEIYKQQGLNPISIKQSPAMLNILSKNIINTNNTLRNLTLTAADSANVAFIDALDNVYMQIVSGGFDYNTAILNSIKDLTDKGLDITYPITGHKDKIDVAIRRNIQTAVNQTACKIQDARADEMNCDLVETSTHAGARPGHAIWQGQIFSRSGESKKYPDFVKSTGYGTGAGLGGWNCRHNYYPYFEGSERSYTNKELEEINDRKVTYNNKKYTEYEAIQMQRQAERNIRAMKRELVGYDTIINSNEEISLRQEAQNRFDILSVKFKKQENELKSFINQTDLKRDKSREIVIEFNKKISKKVTINNKKIVENKKTYDIVGTDKVDINGITKEGKNSLKNAYNTVLNHGISTNTETLLNIDKMTGLNVINKLDGIKSSVSLTDNAIKVLKSSKNSSIISIHNHPSSSSFSTADMKVMNSFESIDTIIAVGHNNTIYTLSIGDGKRPYNYIIDENFYMLKKDKFEYYRNKVKNKEMTSEQAMYEHSHYINEQLSKLFGWKYRRYELNEKNK